MVATTWIAELPVVYVHPDGRRAEGRIAVGRPTGGVSGEARCTVALDGLESRQLQIAGEGTLQALLLGLRFLASQLHGFVSRGGRIVYRDDDEDVGLENIFGPLLQDPPAARARRSGTSRAKTPRIRRPRR